MHRILPATPAGWTVRRSDAVAPREARERLEFRGEVVEGGPGRQQVLPIILEDLRPLRVGQHPIGRVGQFREVPHAEVGGDRLERGECGRSSGPGGQVDVVGLDLGPVDRTVPQFRRQSPALVMDESVRDPERVLAGEDGPQDRQVVVLAVVADQRPAGRRNLVQDLGEPGPVAVDAPVRPIGRQEAAAPAARDRPRRRREYTSRDRRCILN